MTMGAAAVGVVDVVRVPLAAIRIGERHRTDMGDLRSLADSIEARGLLHPVVVTSDHRLVAGQRRIEAVRLLGWQDVPVTVIDVDDLLFAERDENAERKDFTPTEAVAISYLIEERERVRVARQRTAVNQIRGLEKRGESIPPELRDGAQVRGDVREIVASAVGMSHGNLTLAREVVSQANADPETFGDLPAIMDQTGNIGTTFTELARRRASKSGNPEKPRHEVHHKRHYPQANKMMERAVTQIEGIVSALGQMEMAQLDDKDRPRWAASLGASLKVLSALHRALRS